MNRMPHQRGRHDQLTRHVFAKIPPLSFNTLMARRSGDEIVPFVGQQLPKNVNGGTAEDRGE
jgi:hypothetical protein